MSLTQEEMDCIIYDARNNDLESLKEIFSEYDPKLLLTTKDEFSLITPLHASAANGHLEVVEYLLSILPESDCTKWRNAQNESGNTPLHWASLNGHLAVVKALCGKGSDPFVKNEAGHDSIFQAEHNGKEDVENWFLEEFSIEPEEEDAEDVAYQPGHEIETSQNESRTFEDEVKKLEI